MNLQKFLFEDDVGLVRTALRLEFNDTRLTKEDLLREIHIVERERPEVFEPYAEKSFARGMDTNKDEWTENYFDQQVGYLKTNYAMDRFLHLVEVREVLREKGVAGFAPTSA